MERASPVKCASVEQVCYLSSPRCLTHCLHTTRISSHNRTCCSSMLGVLASFSATLHQDAMACAARTLWLLPLELIHRPTALRNYLHLHTRPQSFWILSTGGTGLGARTGHATDPATAFLDTRDSCILPDWFQDYFAPL
jgi:hypothetical protein